ncbi:MAG: glycosyltransferase, partial [Acidimicrobiales bacterium]
ARAGKGAGSSRAIVLGWVEDMERLVAAADVVVENAGGLTAMEAMASGVPVVSYAPIAGHGRANAYEMDRAGVSLFAHHPAQLIFYLEELCRDSSCRHQTVAEGRGMFRADAARVLAQWANAGDVAVPVPEDEAGFTSPRPPRHRPHPQPVAVGPSGAARP